MDCRYAGYRYLPVTDGWALSFVFIGDVSVRLVVVMRVVVM